MDVYSSRFYCPFCETWHVHIIEHHIHSINMWYWSARCENCYASGPNHDDLTVSPQVALDTWMKIVPDGIEVPEPMYGILYGKLPKEVSDV